MRTAIGIPLDTDTAEPELTPSPVALDKNNNTFLGLCYRVDVQTLKDWATVKSFMKEGIGFVVHESEMTDDFKQFVNILYGSNWE